MPKTEKKTPPTPTAPAPVVLPDLSPAAAVIDAAALLAQVATPTPQAKPDTPDLRALLDLYEQTPEKNTAQRAAIMREIRAGAGDKVKLETQQSDVRKQEKAGKVSDFDADLLLFLQHRRAEDKFFVGTERYDIDSEAATFSHVKGKSKEKAGGERNAVGKEDMSAAGVTAFILADGTECTAIVRGQTARAHPYAYLNGAHPTRPYFGKNLFREGMTVEDAVKVRKEYGLDGELSEGQARDLKNGRLTFGDDPARLTHKLGKEDTTTRARFADGSEKTVADFIKELDAPTA